MIIVSCIDFEKIMHKIAYLQPVIYLVVAIISFVTTVNRRSIGI